MQRVRKSTFLQLELLPVEPGVCRFSVPQVQILPTPVAFVLYHQASASGKGSCHGEQNLVCLDSPKVMEMHPDCKSPFFVQSVNVTKPTEWILRQKIPPQTDTHPQSRPRVAGRWPTCWRRWEFPTCLDGEWGAWPEIHPGCWQSLKELVGTLPSFGVCGWQGATLHKPAVLHSFGEILTHLRRTFCFTSYSLLDLRGDVNWHRPGELRKLSLEHGWGLVLS